MTKLEIINANKALYEETIGKIVKMEQGSLERVVAENLILVWISNNKWLGGLSDSKYMKIVERVCKTWSYKFSEEEIDEEFNRQIKVMSL